MMNHLIESSLVLLFTMMLQRRKMLFIEMKQSGNFHMIASLITILKETTDLTFHKNNTLKHDGSF